MERNVSRIAIVCLTAAAIAGPALAQAPAVPAASVAAPAPAPAVAAPAAAAPAPAPLPTDGIGARVLQVLDGVCMPMIRQPGQDQKVVAKTLGLKKSREDHTWSMKLTGVDKLSVRMPNPGNVASCEIMINYAVGQGPAVASALTAWGANQPAPLQGDKVAEPYDIDGLRYTTTNWVGFTASTRMGLAFTEQKKTDGSPAGKGTDQATVNMSFRALTDQDRQ